MAGNNIEDISALGNLKKLKKLNLNNTNYFHNKINNISALKNLSNIVELNLKGNDIKDISALSNLKNLKELLLDNNQITDISALSNLVNLQKLWLDNNRIIDVSELKDLKKLSWLNLTNNRIKELSEWICYFPNMDIQWIEKEDYGYITLYDNPLKEPPIEIVKQGKDAIRDYFENAKTRETEVKLIFTGNSRAGKTTLLEFMKNPTVFREEESTHGITVDNFKWRNFNLNVWDFGGQDYYHATHRLFLTNNSVYILVWEQNTNKPEKKETPIFIAKEKNTKNVKLRNYDYYHWLTVIRKYDDLGRKNSIEEEQKKHKSPIIMLQNKIDDTETGNNQIEKLNKLEQEKYSIDDNNLFAVSIKETHRNWENTARYAQGYVNEYKNFENRMQELIKTELENRKVLVYDTVIRAAVRDRSENIISFSDYKKMCSEVTKFVLEAPITERQIRFATERFHTRGVLIYYGYTSKSNLLKENVFIKPQYVTDIIYDILNKNVKKNDGKFTLNDAVDVLKTFQEPEEAKYDAQLFIDLMKSPNFELIFEYKYEPNTYYATQYLPENIAKNIKSLFEQQIQTYELAFVLQYQGFFSQSIISRIIAFYGFGANRHSATGLFWKNGLSFTLNGVSFWVYCKFEEKKIYLKAQKNKKSETIYNIYNEIVRISENDENISISLDDNNFDAVAKIKKAENENKKYWFCFGKKYESVTISNNIAINGDGNIILQGFTGDEIKINYNDTEKLNSVIEQFKQIQLANNVQYVNLLADIKKEILEIKEKIQPVDQIKELLYRSKKYNEILNKRLDKQDKQLDEISEKLDSYYDGIILKLQNEGVEIKKLEDFITKTSQQSTDEIKKISIELTSLIAEAFSEYEEKFDDEMIKIQEFLNKPSDNWATKIKLAVPILNLIGIKIEHEVKLNKYLKWIHNNL